MSLINYEFGQTFIESFMIDSCVITRLKGGVEVEVLDTVTGKLIDPQGALVTVYTGNCLVKRQKLENQPATIAGQYANYSAYKVLIPAAVSDVRFGDIITVTASRDPSLLAHKLRAVDVWAGTHEVYRAMWTVDLTAGVRTED